MALDVCDLYWLVIGFCSYFADLQLPENAELIWDDGSAFPEPCLDDVAPMVGKV